MIKHLSLLVFRKALDTMSGTENLKQIAKVIPDIYNDGLQPAVKETGQVLALLPKTINAALAPLRQWINEREYNVAETKKLLEQKLSKVGAEHIVTPEPYVAVPALQAISYSMSSEVLRNLYANLLARSMDETAKNRVHPSFVEIIKQLFPDEAKLIKRISNEENIPLIDIQRIVNEEGSFFVELHNFTNLADNVCDKHTPGDVAEYIDNLCRLKIIEIPEGRYLSAETIYKPLKEHSVVVKIMNTPLPEGQSWEIVKKKVEITSFGREFIDVCVKDL